MADQQLLRDLDHAVFGNAKEGLVSRVAKVEGDLYRDEKTGEPGIVADVRQIKGMVTQMRGAWWAVGALLLLIQLADKLGVFAALRGGS